MLSGLRILVLTADFPPDVWSGIGHAVASQVSALCNLGLTVHVLVSETEPERCRTASANGLTVQSLSDHAIPVNPAQFDLVHVHSIGLSELALEIGRRYELPVIYTCHSLFEKELSGHKCMNLWVQTQQILWLACDHVIFLSSAERLGAITRLPALENYSSVIPNGVTLPKQTISNRPGQPLIAFAGRFTKSKGVDLLLDIIQRLAPMGYRFVLAGGHGDPVWERRIFRVVHEYPETCFTTGWLDREALDRLIVRANLVLIPSQYEPFGLVALEAMRLGTPVLASAVGGLLDIIRPDSGGRLVDSRDPEIWCAEIRKMLTNSTLSQRLQENGPRYVEDHYGSRYLAHRLVAEVYQPCLQRKPTNLSLAI